MSYNDGNGAQTAGGIGGTTASGTEADKNNSGNKNNNNNNNKTTTTTTPSLFHDEELCISLGMDEDGFCLRHPNIMICRPAGTIERFQLNICRICDSEFQAGGGIRQRKSMAAAILSIQAFHGNSMKWKSYKKNWGDEQTTTAIREEEEDDDGDGDGDGDGDAHQKDGKGKGKVTTGTSPFPGGPSPSSIHGLLRRAVMRNTQVQEWVLTDKEREITTLKDKMDSLIVKYEKEVEKVVSQQEKTFTNQLDAKDKEIAALKAKIEKQERTITQELKMIKSIAVKRANNTHANGGGSSSNHSSSRSSLKTGLSLTPGSGSNSPGSSQAHIHLHSMSHSMSHSISQDQYTKQLSSSSLGSVPSTTQEAPPRLPSRKASDKLAKQKQQQHQQHQQELLLQQQQQQMLGGNFDGKIDAIAEASNSHHTATLAGMATAAGAETDAANNNNSSSNHSSVLKEDPPKVPVRQFSHQMPKKISSLTLSSGIPISPTNAKKQHSGAPLSPHRPPPTEVATSLHSSNHQKSLLPTDSGVSGLQTIDSTTNPPGAESHHGIGRNVSNNNQEFNTPPSLPQRQDSRDTNLANAVEASLTTSGHETSTTTPGTASKGKQRSQQTLGSSLTTSYNNISNHGTTTSVAEKTDSSADGFRLSQHTMDTHTDEVIFVAPHQDAQKRIQIDQFTPSTILGGGGTPSLIVEEKESTGSHAGSHQQQEKPQHQHDLVLDVLATNSGESEGQEISFVPRKSELLSEEEHAEFIQNQQKEEAERLQKQGQQQKSKQRARSPPPPPSGPPPEDDAATPILESTSASSPQSIHLGILDSSSGTADERKVPPRNTSITKSQEIEFDASQAFQLDPNFDIVKRRSSVADMKFDPSQQLLLEASKAMNTPIHTKSMVGRKSFVRSGSQRQNDLIASPRRNTMEVKSPPLTGGKQQQSQLQQKQQTQLQAQDIQFAISAPTVASNTTTATTTTTAATTATAPTPTPPPPPPPPVAPVSQQSQQTRYSLTPSLNDVPPPQMTALERGITGDTIYHNTYNPHAINKSAPGVGPAKITEEGEDEDEYDDELEMLPSDLPVTNKGFLKIDSHRQAHNLSPVSALTTGSYLFDKGIQAEDGGEIDEGEADGPRKALHHAGFTKRLPLEEDFDSGDDDDDDDDDDAGQHHHHHEPHLRASTKHRSKVKSRKSSIRLQQQQQQQQRRQHSQVGGVPIHRSPRETRADHMHHEKRMFHHPQQGGTSAVPPEIQKSAFPTNRNIPGVNINNNNNNINSTPAGMVVSPKPKKRSSKQIPSQGGVGIGVGGNIGGTVPRKNSRHAGTTGTGGGGGGGGSSGSGSGGGSGGNGNIPKDNKLTLYVEGQRVKDKYGDGGTYKGYICADESRLPHGKGKMLYDNARQYDGEWRDGRWHGYGKWVNPNGDCYEGTFVYDARHGKGVYTWKNGNIYRGEFHEDKRQGKGTFNFANGNVYEGDFVNGVFEGEGRYNFDSGFYEGTWKSGRYHGTGFLMFSDGSSYKGDFLDGVAHGKGEETGTDGGIRRGIWENGRPT